MCTITLSYDQNNALARRKLAAFMDHSKKSMANVIARYMKC